MKSIPKRIIGLFLLTFVNCQVARDEQGVALQSQSGQFSEFPQFEHRFTLKDHQGSTF